MPKKQEVSSGEMNDYEKERQKRIEENRTRMQALGLPNLATSLKKPEKNTTKQNKPKKRTNNDDDDDEYMPTVQEEDTEENDSSSSEQDDSEDEYYQPRSRSRTPKGKKKSTTSKKKVQVQKDKSNSAFDDEDEAFLQAIALSLQDKMLSRKEGCSSSKGPNSPMADVKFSEKKGNAHIQGEPGTRKRKKQVSNRLQMTEDELVLHFFRFDDAGKGSINVRDLELMAATHDFTWTDKELADMIHCFDSDGDGKLNLADFRKIVGRCNMIQSSECS